MCCVNQMDLYDAAVDAIAATIEPRAAALAAIAERDDAKATAKATKDAWDASIDALEPSGYSDAAQAAQNAARAAYDKAASAVPPLVAWADVTWAQYELVANAARGKIDEAAVAGAPYAPATLTTPAAKDVHKILEEDREKWDHGRSDPV
jgi:hypothetical protein